MIWLKNTQLYQTANFIYSNHDMTATIERETIFYASQTQNKQAVRADKLEVRLEKESPSDFLAT